ncbi:MAG: RNA ligase family protein [Nitrososphaerota archaeon]
MDRLTRLCLAFDRIESTSSRNEKIELLLVLIDQDIAKQLFKIALDPARHYGFTKLPIVDPSEGKCTIEEFLDIMDKAEEGKASAADVAAVISRGSPVERKWLARIAEKNLRMGVDVNTINRVWPGLIRTYSCQLAETAYDLSAIKYPVYVQIKIDGIRAQVINFLGAARIVSRNGLPLYNVEHILKDVIDYLPIGFVYDGELYAGSFTSTSSIVKSKASRGDSTNVKFFVFDVIEISEWDTAQCSQIYRARYAQLRSTVKNTTYVIPLDAKLCMNEKEVLDVYNAALESGYEGIVIKQPNAPYEFKRSRSWLKYKPINTIDCKIVGVAPGFGKYEHMLGSLIVKSPDGQICEVGSGFTDEDRKELWANPPIGEVCEIKFKERSSRGKFREPVFVRMK